MLYKISLAFMLTIKLRPTGKKHQRYFRLAVMEKRSKLQGRCVDDMGWVDPHKDTYNINKEKTLQWIKNGAKPTDTAHNLLVRSGVLHGPKRPVHAAGKKKTESVEKQG